MDDLHNNSFNATVATTDVLLFRHSLMLWTVCTIGAIAFAEHLTILLLTFLNKTLRQKPYVVAILLLSTSDILMSLAMLLVSLINLVPLKQTWVCGLGFFLSQVGYVTSLVHTLIICTERYLCMRPIPVEMLSLRKRLALTMINICLCSLILGIPFLFTSRKTTMETCNLSALYDDNLAYVQVPMRSLTLLLWSSTIIIYILTIKNYQNIVKRNEHLDTRHYVARAAFPSAKTEIKSTENSQSEVGRTSLSCTTIGLNTSREGENILLEINTQSLHSRSEMTIIGDETEKAKHVTWVGARTFDGQPSESMAIQDAVNCTISQFDSDTISSLSVSKSALSRPSKGMGLNLDMHRQTLHSGVLIGIDAGREKDTAGSCASASITDDEALDFKCRIFQDAGHVSYQVDVHYETGHVTGINRGSKDCVESDETDAFQNKCIKQEDNEYTQGPRSTHLDLPPERQKRDKLRRISQTTRDNHMIRAFKIVSVVFVFFLITMTPQCVTGLVMIFCSISDIAVFLSAMLATSSLILNPVIYILLLKDFRKVVLICK